MKFKLAVLTTLLLSAVNAWAEDTSQTYEVTVTNLTRSINLTPILALSHNRNASVFTLGEQASDALADLAEGGATMPLQDLMMGTPAVLETTTTGGLLGPGESVVFEIDADSGHRLLSLVSMMLPTNDAFVAINGIKFPRNSRATVTYGIAYDAGSEMNDELCANIPGPTCGGAPFSEGQAEGFVYVSNGISGQGDLDAGVYDWNNPVISVSIHLQSEQ